MRPFSSQLFLTKDRKIYPKIEQRRAKSPNLKTITGNKLLKIKNGIFSEKIFEKKVMKGKLINLANKSLLVGLSEIHPDLFNDYNFKPDNTYGRFSNIEPSNKINIFTSKSPHILDNKLINKRFQDYYTTADELIYKNFNNIEISMIRSDPNYFKLHSKKFKDIDFFKKKRLIDTLNEEEKENKIISPIRNISTKAPKNRLIYKLQHSIKKSMNKIRTETQPLKDKKEKLYLNEKFRILSSKSIENIILHECEPEAKDKVKRLSTLRNSRVYKNMNTSENFNNGKKNLFEQRSNKLRNLLSSDK
jgi:hypothetical protein